MINDPLRVCICIPSFKRPKLLSRCLESLAKLELNNSIRVDLKIQVVDNDPERLSFPAVESARLKNPWPIQYAVEERRGISFARNRLVNLSRGYDFIAFIDDDETASPLWINELLYVQHNTSADAVIGPVEPVFEKLPPDWMAPFFQRQRYPSGDKVSFYDFKTGNVLLSTKAISAIKEPFDPVFALTGGEDTYLGRCLEANGACLHWADNAIVYEYFSKSRTKVSWLLQRHFRGGMSFAMMDMRFHNLLFGLIVRFSKGLACIPYGVFWCLSSLILGRTAFFRGIFLVSWGIGSLAGLLGIIYKEYETIHGQ